MKKYLITVDTNWSGTDRTYRVESETYEEVENLAQTLSYENFYQYDFYEDIKAELMDDSLSEEELHDLIISRECEYYFYYIEEFLGPLSEWFEYEEANI